MTHNKTITKKILAGFLAVTIPIWIVPVAVVMTIWGWVEAIYEDLLEVL